MGQSIDCQPHFGHQVGRRKASYANHPAQVGEKTAVCLLSDRLLGALFPDVELFKRIISCMYREKARGKGLT